MCVGFDLRELGDSWLSPAMWGNVYVKTVPAICTSLFIGVQISFGHAESPREPNMYRENASTAPWAWLAGVDTLDERHLPYSK